MNFPKTATGYVFDTDNYYFSINYDLGTKKSQRTKLTGIDLTASEAHTKLKELLRVEFKAVICPENVESSALLCISGQDKTLENCNQLPLCIAERIEKRIKNYKDIHISGITVMHISDDSILSDRVTTLARLIYVRRAFIELHEKIEQDYSAAYKKYVRTVIRPSPKK